MASKKTPGSDGLPCEFYKVFWNDLAKILLNALNFSFETGALSISTLEEQLTHSDVNDEQKKQIWCDIEGKNVSQRQ